MIRALSFTFLSIVSTCLLAESIFNDFSDFESEFLDELPIVLSASRLAQPINEAPVAITVIDREMIDASGARSIPDLLRLVPGFQVGYFDGNSPIATYHGHADQDEKRLQVLIDGRAVYLPSLNSVPWSDLVLSMDDIERIEVIRGPNASTYGNNSFFAVVSIQTKHAIESQGQYIRVKVGAYNTFDAIYEFGDQIESLDYRVTVTTQNNDGTVHLRDETKADSLSYRLDYQISTTDSLMYQGGFRDTYLGDHEAIPQENQLTGHDIKNQYAFQHIKWEHQIANGDSFSLQYYYNNYDSYERSPPSRVDPADYGLPFDVFDFFYIIDIKTQRHDLEFNYFQQPFDSLRLVWGASTRLDIVNALDVFDMEGTQRLKLNRGFLQAEWRATEDWLLNAGLMVESNDISGNDISPRLAIIHHINNNHTVRLGYSKATRTPTLFEEAGKLIFTHPLTLGGSPTGLEASYTRLLTPGNLKSEKITSVEFGYFAKLMNKKLFIDLKIYKDRTSDIIVTGDGDIISLPDLNAGTPVQLLINDLESNIHGAEASANFQLNKDLRIYAFYANIHITSDHPVYGIEVGNSAPKHSAGMMVIKNWANDINTSVVYYHVGSYAWGDRDDIQAPGRVKKMDVTASKTYKFGNERLKITLIGNNVTGDNYDYNKTLFNTDGTVNDAGSLQERSLFVDIKFMFN